MPPAQLVIGVPWYTPPNVSLDPATLPIKRLVCGSRYGREWPVFGKGTGERQREIRLTQPNLDPNVTCGEQSGLVRCPIGLFAGRQADVPLVTPALSPSRQLRRATAPRSTPPSIRAGRRGTTRPRRRTTTGATTGASGGSAATRTRAAWAPSTSTRSGAGSGSGSGRSTTRWGTRLSGRRCRSCRPDLCSPLC